jgi:hypothetical protein
MLILLLILCLMYMLPIRILDVLCLSRQAVALNLAACHPIAQLSVKGPILMAQKIFEITACVK